MPAKGLRTICVSQSSCFPATEFFGPCCAEPGGVRSAMSGTIFTPPARLAPNGNTLLGVDASTA